MTENEIKCGIIMPISEIEDCNENHWNDVLAIYKNTVAEIGFVPNLVSDSDDIGVIHKRIIDNLYTNPIVICDISCRNANVMFELGIRLAFDKPTIIVKDDKTPFSFDTSIIEHLTYPRDLNYVKILHFREQLKIKIKATFAEFQDNNEYSTFLKHFGQYKISKLKESEVSSVNYIMNSLIDINEKLNKLSFNNSVKESLDLDRISLDKNKFVLVDFSDFIEGEEYKKINIYAYDTFRDFLDKIYFQIKKHVEPFTYEYDWILINVETGEKIYRLNCNIPRGDEFFDKRPLYEVGITNKVRLKVKELE